MRLSSTLYTVLVCLAIASILPTYALGFGTRPERARDCAGRMLERARARAEEDLIPLSKLAGTAPGEVVFVHDVETLEPIYGLVEVVSPAGDFVGMIAVDARSQNYLWSSFRCPADRLFPVSSEAAGDKLAASHVFPSGSKAGEPTLVSGRDKRLYWRFARDAESHFVDAIDASAAILSSTDGSDRKVLARAGRLAYPDDLGRPLAGDPGPDPALTDPPPSYFIPGLSYHFQITDWYCGPAALQTVMDFYGAEVPQVDIAHVGNDRGVGPGVDESDLRRAASFSGMSVAIQDSSLEGYAERKLGYSAVDAYFATNRAIRLKRIIAAGYPVIARTWWNPGHDAWHYRVVCGYDDSLDVFVCQDPWYWAGWWGPEVLIDQTFFAEDLWSYGMGWGMMTAPWILTPSLASEIAVGDTFSVDLGVLYPGAARFSGSYPCSSCQATIHLSPGLALAAGSPTTAVSNMFAGDSAVAHWDVVAVGPPGEWGISFQAQGILNASSESYDSYSDSVGGHAYETVLVGAPAPDDWDPEERISDAGWTARTCYPGSRAMVTSGDGTLHVVWSDMRDGDSEIYYGRRADGVWDAPTRLTESPGMSSNPCIAQGADGRLHVAWSDYRDMTYEIYYKVWDPVGGWSADERVTTHAELDYYPAIAAGDTSVYLVWEYHTGSSYRVAGVVFSERTGAGWTVPVDVDQSTTRDAYRPTIACGPDGVVHVAYERQSANDPTETEQIAYRSWNGASWSARTLLSTATSFSRTPSIAIGPDSTVHLVWQDGENTGGDIYYRKHDGTAWQPVEEVAAGGTEASTPSVAGDADSHAHVVWVDNRNGESEIYYREAGASGWEDPVRITRGPGSSVLPAVGIAPSGDVSIVWTDSRSGVAGVYFKEKTCQSGVRPLPPAPGVNIAMGLPYPQPFAAETRVEFSLLETADVAVDIFNVKGELVRRLASDTYAPGTHHAIWDGTSERGTRVSAGIYFLRCASESGAQARPVILLR